MSKTKSQYLFCVLFILYGFVNTSFSADSLKFLKPDSILGNEIAATNLANPQVSFSKKLETARDYINHAQPDNALPIIFELLESKNLPYDTIQLSNVLIAEAYRLKREYKKGINLIYSVLESTSVPLRNRAYAYNRLAALYNELDNPIDGRRDSAVKYSQLSIEISEKNGFTNLLASSQNELGYIYRLRGDFPKAKQYCQSAYINFRQLQMYPDAINAAINLCGAYLNTGEFEKGLSLIDSAAALGSEEQSKNLFMRLYLRKSDILVEQKDFKNAFFALTKARELNEGYYKNLISKQISEMSAKYDLQIKEQQIRDIKQQNRIQRQQKLFVFILSIILIISFIITNFNYRLKRKIREKEQALVEQENIDLKLNLKLKEQELTFKNKELSQVLTNMIAYYDTITGIKQAAKDNNNVKVLDIIASKQYENRTWQKFKKTFHDLYPDFLAKLDKQFPQLTENDRHLCSFLLMDMKTSEIGTVLNISEAGVSKNRNRLRKKLNLKNGADIKDFLQAL